MPYEVELSNDVTLRLLSEDDAELLLDAYRRNQEHLAPWDPARSESFYTVEEQHRVLRELLDQHAEGAAHPLVLVQGTRVIGRLNISGIVRGPFQSGNVGYWIDREHTGHGLASAALQQAITQAKDQLGLHRLQAGTLLHNVGSQKVLRRAGFEPIGVAPQYLKIAGMWQDHLLFQVILHQ